MVMLLNLLCANKIATNKIKCNFKKGKITLLGVPCILLLTVNDYINTQKKDPSENKFVHRATKIKAR